jgi:hypothetical protein
MSPALLDQDIETQNICCDIVLKILNDQKEGLALTYRHLIKERVWDDYCKIVKNPNVQEAYDKLEETITIPFSILTKINYKYKCTELCPFPICLEELHSWEMEMVLHYPIINDIIGWVDVGLPMEKVARWFNVDISDVRRWNQKRKKIGERVEIFKGFQPFIKYMPNKCSD